jgi:hypothetical protein
MFRSYGQRLKDHKGLILLTFVALLFTMLLSSVQSSYAYNIGTGNSGSTGGSAGGTGGNVELFLNNKTSWGSGSIHQLRSQTGISSTVSYNKFDTVCQAAINNTPKSASNPAKVIGVVINTKNEGAPYYKKTLYGVSKGVLVSGVDRNWSAKVSGLSGYDSGLQNAIKTALRNAANYNNLSIACVAINFDDANPTGYKLVVASEKQYYELASVATATKKTMPQCPVYYTNTVEGTDGYTYGKALNSSKDDKQLTPYGQVWKDVQAGKYNDKTYDELVDAATAACNETNQSTSTSTSLDANSDIMKSYARGGIVKVTKYAQKATITYTIPGIDWYYRTYTRRTWKVTTCKMSESGCARSVSNKSPENINISAWKKNATTKDMAATGWKNGMPGELKNRTFNRYNCGVGSNKNTSRTVYLQGCPGSGYADSLIPVSNNETSWVHVSHYYLLNILCDRNDFNAYRNLAKVAKNIAKDTSTVAGGSKFQGSLESKVSTTTDGTDNDIMFPRITKTLGLKAVGYVTSNETAFWTAYGSTATYKATNDPVYTKECPFDCVATADKNASNGSGDNVGTNGAAKSTAAGMSVFASDDKGNLPTSSTSNSSVVTFFRNNAWNQLTSDLWYPSNGNGVTYDGSSAISTTITKNTDGTPWLVNGSQITKIESNDGTELFTDTNAAPSQISPQTASAFEGSNGATLSGQVTSFKIKSSWASDANKPLKFNVKWEYNADNAVNVPSEVSFTSTNPTTTYKSVTTTSDGKCYAQYDRTTTYPDFTTLFHDNTGANVANSIDTQQQDAISHFDVQFVRSTAE